MSTNYYWIDEIIEGLLEEVGSNDINDILDYLGIVTIKDNSKNVLLSSSDAFYIRNIDGVETILIRDNLPAIFEKYVLAHELGHAILHVDIMDAAYSKFTIKNKLEKEADYFAIRILNITLDKTELEGLTKQQIAGLLQIKVDSLDFFIN
ncbi:ImmA/IrrE family metallo-endopeptidase [Microaceticoccus formicicus]|uniref:ImmA/IrrE family metallo-endopeptidase n=1 Tax=Microaceticoccus formicicus TaxID=3118105 RepID=UPI003CD0048B|nr:ImmA/IrrE family metallo-endopeptidase [Peptoniphilaceae bacterium AMB_02]